MPVTSLILKTPATESKVLVSIYGSTAADCLLTKILASFGYGVPVTPLPLAVTLRYKDIVYSISLYKSLKIYHI